MPELFVQYYCLVAVLFCSILASMNVWVTDLSMNMKFHLSYSLCHVITFLYPESHMPEEKHYLQDLATASDFVLN